MKDTCPSLLIFQHKRTGFVAEISIEKLDLVDDTPSLRGVNTVGNGCGADAEVAGLVLVIDMIGVPVGRAADVPRGDTWMATLVRIGESRG